jgi:GDP-4-dehydro-6-deoxy-D-mannose reductase
MKVLVTGIGGFVGVHLARHLLEQPDVTVIGTTYLPSDEHPDLIKAGVPLHRIDLTDAEAIYNLLRDEQPDQIYHLAAQSFVPESFDDPWGTLRNNIQGELNILQSMIRLGLNVRVLVVSSGEIYGPVSPEDIPIDEEQPLRPSSPYSVSKVAQDMLGLQYYLSHNLPVIRVRPFNQIGPGQSKRFVVPAFASQIAAIEAGQQEPVLYVGSLEARRDFTDVRDMVRAYRLVMALGAPGAVYNIGTGQAHSIGELLDILLHHTDAPIEVQIDPGRLRPVEIPIIVANPARVKATTGWEPAFTFEQTLVDVLDEWRYRFQRPGSP